MRLQPHHRHRVVFSSSVYPARRYGVLQRRRPERSGRVRRFMRIGMLVAVIAVRPRWRPLLAGIVLTVLGGIERQGAGGVFAIPGLLLLWQALLTPSDTDADRERRSQLRRELAAYSTPAQRGDLEATLDRYPDGTTCEIRDLLATYSIASQNWNLGSGPY
jgi:hypothetical protein